MYLEWVLMFLVLDDSCELSWSHIDDRIIQFVNCITKLFDILFEKHLRGNCLYKLVGSMWRVSRVFESLMWLRFLAGKRILRKFCRRKGFKKTCDQIQPRLLKEDKDFCYSFV